MLSGCAASPTASTARTGPCWSSVPRSTAAAAWDAGVAFAEKLGAPVYSGPLPDRASFPEDHRLYQGPLPMTVAGATEVLRGHDLVVVIGAQVFRYYPYVAGEYLPEGTDCCTSPTIPPWPRRRRSVTACSATRCWRWSSSWTWSTTTAIETCPPQPSVNSAVDLSAVPAAGPGCSVVDPGIGETRRSPLVTESTSTMAQQLRWIPSTRPGSFFATASGGIGWGAACSGWPGAGRPRPRRQAHGGRHHRRRVMPILRAGDLHGRPTPAADCVRGHAQRGVLDPQVVRGAREDTGCSGSGPTWA